MFARPGFSSEESTGTAWLLMALLTASIFINYIDRSNLAVAAPQLQADLHYSAGQVGSLSSAFFWTYSLLQLVGVSGWISDRYAVTRVFALSFLLWSLATAATGLLSSFAGIWCLRLLLGAGESMAYPCYSRMMASHVPQQLLGRANALLDAGAKLGPALGTFLGGLLLDRFGWRSFFVVLGLTGMLWLLPWFAFTRLAMNDRTPTHSRADTTLYSVRQLLGFRSAWGTFAGHFCGNYFWFFLLTWLPSYLVKERHFSIKGMATIGSVAYLLIAGATLTAGAVSDLLLKRGVSATRVRKSVVVAGLVGSTIIVPVAFVRDTRAAVLLLYAACLAFGTYTSNHWATTQTLAGPMMAGRWTSLQNGLGNFSGIVAAWLTGVLVDRFGSFQLPFIVAALMALLGAVMWGFVVGPVEQVPWRKET